MSANNQLVIQKVNDKWELRDRCADLVECDCHEMVFDEDDNIIFGECKEHPNGVEDYGYLVQKYDTKDEALKAGYEYMKTEIVEYGLIELQ